MGAYQYYLEQQKQASALAMAATNLAQNMPDMLEFGQHMVQNPWLRHMAKTTRTSLNQVGVGGTLQGAALRTLHDATPNAVRQPLAKNFRAAGDFSRRRLGADSEVTNFLRTAEQATRRTP